jgi:cytochrome c oxidase cbb3-type subunit 4
MDINDLRSAVTVISLLLFVGLVAITMKPSRRSEFEEAAHLPFAEDTSREDRT